MSAAAQSHTSSVDEDFDAHVSAYVRALWNGRSVALQSSLNSGAVGLGISLLMQLTGTVQWLIRQSAEVENQMVSVERVLEYTRLPVEEFQLTTTDDSTHRTTPPPQLRTTSTDATPTVAVPQWPAHGAIVFKNVWMKVRLVCL